ncbi:hypothetical protein ACE1OC_05825 [Streptomyces sp. DSM 116496]|uniref:hypothetical protein n=1 Tax=Streptomyces stoeckheimensis TaxID=3344656 RepID=UPI0038B35695
MASPTVRATVPVAEGVSSCALTGAAVVARDNVRAVLGARLAPVFMSNVPLMKRTGTELTVGTRTSAVWAETVIALCLITVVVTGIHSALQADDTPRT